jgi:endonuclease YncB( thermonuclease family)
MVAFNFPRITRPAQPRQLARTSDGDTPVIDQPVRMVSVDTPEKAEYAGLPLPPRPSWTAAANASKTTPTRISPRPCAPTWSSGSPKTRPSGTLTIAGGEHLGVI